MKYLSLVIVLATLCGCSRRDVEVVPFPFDFPEKSDGCGFVYVRKLSIQQTESIHVRVSLSQLGHDVVRQFYKGREPLRFDLSPTQTVASSWIENYPSKPDGFMWGHFMSPTNLTDKWACTSGTVTLSLSKPPDGVPLALVGVGFWTSVSLSNVVFASANTPRITTLPALSFTNVHVGWLSE